MGDAVDRDELRVCMVVFSNCPADPRVRRESEALVEAGMTVHVVCLRDDDQPAYEVVNGVHLYHVPLRRRRGGGRSRYLMEYGLFIALAGLWVSALHLRHRYDVVHVHNMPDILVVSGMLPRLTGARMILDLHDPMPEVYMTKYNIGADHPVIRVLRKLERFSIGVAHQVLTPNIAFRDIFVERGCPPEKIEIIMNSPDPRVFGKPGAMNVPTESDPAGPECFRLMYHGTVVERHGLGTALRAVALLRRQIPGLEFHVFGGGDYVDRFLELRDELQLTDAVTYHGWVPLETVAEWVPKIDLGLVPNKRSVFTEINLPTRLFEYLCMGKPVVAPQTKGIHDYFPEDALYYFEAGDPASLAEVIYRAWRDPVERQAIVRRGRQVHARHQWTDQRDRLVALVRQLARRIPVALPEGVKGE